MPNAALSSVDPRLRRLFAPQAEQLGFDLRPVGAGYAAAADLPRTRGTLWAAPVGRSCLVLRHAVLTPQPFELEELPLDCVCACSADEASCGMILKRKASRAPGSRDNLVAYSRREGTERFLLDGGVRYDACTVCLLPEFFVEGEIARDELPGFEEVARGVELADPEALPESLHGVFRRIEAVARAGGPGEALHLRALATETAAVLVDHALEARISFDAQGAPSQRGLVRRACALVDETLAQAPTLDELARRLYVGRTRLCEAFRRETGESMGRYVRRRRIEHAQELLATTDTTVEAVGRAVGYRNPGAFAEAFRRETGLLPSVWRRQA